MTSYDLDWFISVDDHVLEPPNVWQDRVPQKYKERAPRIMREDGEEFWAYDGLRKATEGMAAAAGKDKQEFSPEPLSYEDMRPGCYEPKARVEDMNEDGCIASVCFPSFPRFAGQVFYEAKDKELALLCVQAYNDWMIDEWSGSQPGRFIPNTLIPMWDPQLSAREIERCSAKGAKAFAFSENPSKLGLPSLYDRDRYWDPVLQAASDTGMVICTHIGSSSQLPKTAPDSPLIVSVVLTPMNAVSNLMDWLFSGALVRFPNIKVALSEGGVGWIPYALERAVWTLDRQRHWASKGDFELGGHGTDSEGLSPEVFDADFYQLFRNQVFGCMIDDVFGSKNLHDIGIDNVMSEADYPHTDSTWPYTLKTLKERLAPYTEEEQYKVLQGNARRVFDFTPAEPPSNIRP
ncbi:MAG: hypothetical protein QOJ03_3261 [Frankiaceae bacterium]|nr:hypothetical protein [Frankiaceae bacterium]